MKNLILTIAISAIILSVSACFNPILDSQKTSGNGAGKFAILNTQSGGLTVSKSAARSVSNPNNADVVISGIDFQSAGSTAFLLGNVGGNPISDISFSVSDSASPTSAYKIAPTSVTTFNGNLAAGISTQVQLNVNHGSVVGGVTGNVAALIISGVHDVMVTISGTTTDNNNVTTPVSILIDYRIVIKSAVWSFDQSTDGGNSWTPIADNLNPTSINDGTNKNIRITNTGNVDLNIGNDDGTGTGTYNVPTTNTVITVGSTVNFVIAGGSTYYFYIKTNATVFNKLTADNHLRIICSISDTTCVRFN